jgi:hypothetical protein
VSGGLHKLLEQYKQEARAFRALLTDSEGQHVYPMREPSGGVRYIVLHMPEGEWQAPEVLQRVRTFLVVMAGEARGHQDLGAAMVLERCASMLEAVLRYHHDRERGKR